MSRISLLTGKADGSERRSAAAALAPHEPQHQQMLKLAMDTLNNQLDRAQADLGAARSEAAIERSRATRLQEQIAAETQRRCIAEGELATEKAVSAGLRAQLETERKAVEQLKEPLRQAIAAAAKDPVVVQSQAGAAPDYEVVVTNRDGNNRMRSLTIKPVKQG